MRYVEQETYEIYLVEFCILLPDANHTFDCNLEIEQKCLNRSNIPQILRHLYNTVSLPFLCVSLSVLQLNSDSHLIKVLNKTWNIKNKIMMKEGEYKYGYSKAYWKQLIQSKALSIKRSFNQKYYPLSHDRLKSTCLIYIQYL